MITMTIAALCLAIPAQAVPDFDAFFAEFQKKRDGIRFLEAPFEQTTVTPDETILLKGRIVYSAPKRLLLHYADPDTGEASVLVYITDGLVTYEYDKELGQLKSWKLEDRPETEALFLGFSDDSENLKKAYVIRLVPPAESNKGGVALELTPRDPESEMAVFESATLQLRPGDLLPTQILIVNDAESNVTIRIGEFALGDTAPPDKTHIIVPEGTDIVEDEQYIETAGPEGKTVPGALAVESLVKDP